MAEMAQSATTYVKLDCYERRIFGQPIRVCVLFSPGRNAGKWRARLAELTNLAAKALSDLVKHNGTFPSRQQPLKEINLHFSVTTSENEPSAIAERAGAIDLFLPLTINPPSDDEFIGVVQHALLHLASIAHEDERRMIAALASRGPELLGEAYGSEEEWIRRCERIAAHLWMVAGKRAEHKGRYLDIVRQTETVQAGLPDTLADVALPVVALRLHALPLLRYCIIADARRLEHARALITRIKEMKTELIHSPEGMVLSADAANLVGFIASLYTLPYDSAVLGHLINDKAIVNKLPYTSVEIASLAMLRNDLEKLDAAAARLRFDLFRVCDAQPRYDIIRQAYGAALLRMSRHTHLEKDVRMQRFVDVRVFDGDVIGKLKDLQTALFTQFDELYTAIADHAEGRKTPFQSLKKVETLRKTETLRRRDEDALSRLASLATRKK